MAISTPASITVRVLKHDGRDSRQWSAGIRSQADNLLVLDAEFEIEVTHDSLGTIPKGTRTIEYYWFDRWYNIFQFLTNDGSTKLFYCNINMPPTLKAGVLTYVDLDIDVLVDADLSYRVLDENEFEENAKLFNYSDETKARAQEAVEELKQMIERRQFPFAI